MECDREVINRDQWLHTHEGVEDMMEEVGWRSRPAPRGSFPFWPNWRCGEQSATSRKMRLWWQVVADYHDDERWCCHMLREVLGDVFAPPPVVPRQWLLANGCEVFKVASSIYEENDMRGLCVLADALEDAGYTEASILEHLRNPNAEHVRGCWALDLILGKES